MSKDLAEHLKYFAEMGVTGVSRDPAWRARLEPNRQINIGRLAH
jgi:hypothetical protein